jgi:hypothetical protein
VEVVVLAVVMDVAVDVWWWKLWNHRWSVLMEDMLFICQKCG